MDKPQFIYALRDPRTNEIRYVGKSNNPKVRRKHHMLQSYVFHNKRKAEWIQELYALRLRPNIEILEECTLANWKHRERFWIRKLRNEGCDLLNLAEGGNGLGVWPRGRKVSEQTKTKLRNANRTQFSDSDKKLRHSEGLREWAKGLSGEKLDRVRSGLSVGGELAHAALREKWASMTTDEKTEAVKKQHAWYAKLTPEEKSKFQRSKMTAETLKKIGDAKRGTNQTEESKAKSSESLRKFWASKSEQERTEIALSNWRKRKIKEGETNASL